jgi:oxygen-independent coproporphyrinogen III oxidase
MRGGTDSVGGVYVHVPFCDGKCRYCAFYSAPYSESLADRFLAALEKELESTRSCAPATLYIGGGTPSVLSPSQLRRLCAALGKNFDLSRVKEWTVEINPGSLNAIRLEILARAGVNRFSLGAQAFDERVLQLLGRRHSVRDIFEAVDLLRSAAITNFSLDLIACVPGLDSAIWKKTLKQALALAPAHISVYALSAEEGTRLYQIIDRGAMALLNEEEQAQALDLAQKMLEASGYARYEISNYARPGCECRHNLAYWRGADFLGFGPAATSTVGLRRWTDRADLAGYLEALENEQDPPREMEELTHALKKLERVIFGLRLREGVPAELALPYARQLRELCEAGLVVRQDNRWRLTARGRNLADYVARELLP